VLYWTDLYLEHDVADEAMTVAVASAFGVPVAAVAVAPAGTQQAAEAYDRPTTRVLVQREPFLQPGDFPFRLSVVLKGDAVDLPVDRLRLIARALGVAMITDVETPSYSDEQWRLVAPDGWTDVVLVDSDDSDEAFTLTPETRRLLDAHTAPTQGTHLRQVG